MYILKLKATGDYDRKYYINIASSNDVRFITAVKDKLNEFCKAFDEVDEGFLMSRFFGDILFEKQYNDLLLYLMDYNRANELFRSIKDACNKNYVYLCSDNFEIEEVMSLLK